MIYQQPIRELIERRFSYRTYAGQPIAEGTQAQLREHISLLSAGPFGTPLRFELVAATEEDRSALKRLGTYGFIRGATGFIVGAVDHGPKDFEDYGYAMESLILSATELDLGTCWLGGTFTRSRFADKIHASNEEHVPAVASVGVVANPEQARKGLLRRLTQADRRLPWDSLFFDRRFGKPLARERAGGVAPVLDLVRQAPSGSNKQPWRIVKDEEAWHFYLQRTPGYGQGLATRLLGSKGESFPDIQRIDLGIAICHFDLAARELGVTGTWIVGSPPFGEFPPQTEYVASFVK